MVDGAAAQIAEQADEQALHELTELLLISCADLTGGPEVPGTGSKDKAEREQRRTPVPLLTPMRAVGSESLTGAAHVTNIAAQHATSGASTLALLLTRQAEWCCRHNERSHCCPVFVAQSCQQSYSAGRDAIILLWLSMVLLMMFVMLHNHQQ